MNHTMKLNDYTSRQNNSQNIFEIHKYIQPKKGIVLTVTMFSLVRTNYTERP